jgi:PAS domain-containing protein
VKNATKLAKVGGWELNMLTGEHYWSPMTKEIHEVSDGFIPSLGQAIEFYHPQYREKVQNAVERAEKDGEPFDFEAIILTATGKEKWVRAIGNSEIIEGKCAFVRQFSRYR